MEERAKSSRSKKRRSLAKGTTGAIVENEVFSFFWHGVPILSRRFSPPHFEPPSPAFAFPSTRPKSFFGYSLASSSSLRQRIAATKPRASS